MDDVKPCRRWLRTSLIALLIGVMLAGAWFGWQVKIVRDRKAALKGDRAIGLAVINNAAFRENPRPTVPFYRAWLGDVPVQCIIVVVDATQADKDRLSRQFPEAVVP